MIKECFYATAINWGGSLFAYDIEMRTGDLDTSVSHGDDYDSFIGELERLTNEYLQERPDGSYPTIFTYESVTPAGMRHFIVWPAYRGAHFGERAGLTVGPPPDARLWLAFNQALRQALTSWNKRTCMEIHNA